jgi:hypothetical protein
MTSMSPSRKGPFGKRRKQETFPRENPIPSGTVLLQMLREIQAIGTDERSKVGKEMYEFELG